MKSVLLEQGYGISWHWMTIGNCWKDTLNATPVKEENEWESDPQTGRVAPTDSRNEMSKKSIVPGTVKILP